MGQAANPSNVSTDHGDGNGRTSLESGDAIGSQSWDRDVPARSVTPITDNFPVF
jgi:hypothetical protein